MKGTRMKFSPYMLTIFAVCLPDKSHYFVKSPYFPSAVVDLGGVAWPWEPHLNMIKNV